MPAPARRVHRALALTVSGGLALAGLIVTAGPAAAVPVGAGEAVASIDFDGSGGDPTCSAPTGDAGSTVPFSTDTGAKTVTHTGSTTITDSADTDDVTTLTARASTTASLTDAGGSLRTLDVTTTLRATWASAQGFSTSCDGAASAVGGAETEFNIAEPGWLDVRLSKSAGGLVIMLVGGTDAVLQTYSIRTRSEETYRFFLPSPGTYGLTVQGQVEASIPDTPFDPTSESTTFRAHGEFHAAGAATGKAAGPGAPYLRLADKRACATDNLKTTFTSKASKVKSAQIFVNGKRRAKVANPKGGRVVTLGGLADSKAVTVKAVLALKQGGSVTVTRSYLACS